MNPLEPHYLYIRRCYELAQQAVANGNHPFGALLVVDGEIVLELENTIHTDGDATAHPEFNIVRLAARTLPPGTLPAATLYTSTEPCIMCSGAIYWSGVKGVVYGCSAEGLGRHAGGDFLMPCREIFARAARPVTVIGPVLLDEGEAIHAGYW